MVPRLVTHQVDDTPHLVVVSDDPALADVCRVVAKEAGLLISIVSEKELINQSKTLNAYKIIVIKLNSPVASLPNLAQRIAEEGVPWLFITSFEQAAALQTSTTTALAQINPSATLLLQDVLTPTAKPRWFQEILTQLIDTQLLLFHTIPRFLLRAQDVKPILSQQLFKRWNGQTWQLEGAKFTEQAVVEEFAHQYHQYFQKTLRCEAAESNPISSTKEISLDVEVTTLNLAKKPSLSEILQPIVRNLSPVFESASLSHSPTSTLPAPTIVTSQEHTQEEPKTTSSKQDEKKAMAISGLSTLPHHVYPAINQRVVRVPIKKTVGVEATKQQQSERNGKIKLIQESEKIDKSIKNNNSHDVSAKNEKSLTTPTLEKELQRLFHVSRVENKVSTATQLARETIEVVKKNKRKQIFFFFGLLGAGVTTGIIILVFILNITTRVVKQQTLVGVEALVASQQTTADIQSVAQQLDQSLRILTPQIKAYETVFPATFVEQAHQVAQVGQSLVAVTQNLSRLQQLSSIAFRQILGSEAGDSLQSLQLVETMSQTVFEELSLLKAELKKTPLDEDSQKEVAVLLDTLSHRLVITQQLQPVLKKIMGTQEKRRYAVVLQNEQELRSTGGFIQSVALVTVDRGVVVDYQVFDSYSLDQQFRGSVAPPAQLSTHLNEKQWFFHDSNWAVDGVTAHQDMTTFLEKIFNGKVDGVITMNVKTLSTLIAALGPVDVPEYNEVLTDKNLPERVEFHSEVQLVESSNRAKDYLTVVFGKVLQRVQGVSADKTNPLISAFYESLQQKEVSIYLADIGEQATMSSFGWSGGVVTPPCPVQLSTRGCFVDTVYQVETNIGVNKANYELERSITQDVLLTSTNASHKRTMQFTNRARSNSWPKGPYLALVRVLVPENASIDRVVVGTTSLKPDEVSLQKLGDKLEVAFKVTVPIQSSLDVTVEYQVPLELQSGQAYVLFDQKQPGTGQTPVKMSLNLAEGLHAAKIAPQADVLGSTITFNQIKNDHLFVGVQLQ